MRRSREDISVPSLIPKLLSTRSKEERLKRQDSKDDIRHSSKSGRKEETKFSSLIVVSSTSGGKDEAGKSGIKIFRRDNSREDVGRDSTNPIKESAKGKQQDRQERVESVGGATRSRVAGIEQSRTRCEDDKNDANDIEELSSRNEATIEASSLEQHEIILLDSRIDAENRNTRMLNVIVSEDSTRNERMRERDTMIMGEEVINEKRLLVTPESIESIVENDKERNNNEEELRDTADRLLDVGSDAGDVIGERKGPLEIGYGKRPDEFQVVSEYMFVNCLLYAWARYIPLYVCEYGGVSASFAKLRDFSFKYI